jgi:cell division transport system permease protein
MRLQFLVGEIGNGLRRNLSMAVSVVIVTMISMYLLGLGLMGQRQVDTMKDYWYDRVQVTVLLCAEKTHYTSCAGQATTDAQRQAIRAELEALKPTVKEVLYETRDQAYARFKQTYQNSPLARAGEAYFADSYRVNLNDPNKFDVVASSIKGMPGVADVQDQKKLLEKFFTFMHTVSWAAIALSSLMVLAAVMLISTTIRQTAFSRRRETGIMRLVGASNFTIRFPFVMETVISSVLGAVLAMVMLWATVRYGVVGFLSQTLTDTAFIGVSDVYYVAPFIIAGVVVLASLTSWVTLRRYLRV